MIHSIPFIGFIPELEFCTISSFFLSKHSAIMTARDDDVCCMILFSYGASDVCVKHCSAKGVSSIVGAPCNAVSLCNRAGWLGFGRKQSIG